MTEAQQPPSISNAPLAQNSTLSSGEEVTSIKAVSYTHLRAHETVLDLVCRLLLEKKKNNNTLTDPPQLSTTLSLIKEHIYLHTDHSHTNTPLHT